MGKMKRDSKRLDKADRKKEKEFRQYRKGKSQRFMEVTG